MAPKRTGARAASTTKTATTSDELTASFQQFSQLCASALALCTSSTSSTGTGSAAADNASASTKTIRSDYAQLCRSVGKYSDAVALALKPPISLEATKDTLETKLAKEVARLKVALEAAHARRQKSALASAILSHAEFLLSALISYASACAHSSSTKPSAAPVTSRRQPVLRALAALWSCVDAATSPAPSPSSPAQSSSASQQLQQGDVRAVPRLPESEREACERVWRDALETTNDTLAELDSNEAGDSNSDDEEKKSEAGNQEIERLRRRVREALKGGAQSLEIACSSSGGARAEEDDDDDERWATSVELCEKMTAAGDDLVGELDDVCDDLGDGDDDEEEAEADARSALEEALAGYNKLVLEFALLLREQRMDELVARLDSQLSLQ